ncbi:AAA family ATPase [Streptomyces sp. NPDC048516]|uniref:helix-turn-helix transcriptional regulator n=1 Tax=Streptomyces sp. NPDC048516 TaxID=3365565 RepID=UPI0037240AD1
MDRRRRDTTNPDLPLRVEPHQGRPSEHTAWPFVGRAEELTALEAVAGEVRAGRLQVVQLDGDAGIGKTALLHHWLDGLPDFLVLRARCRPLERDFAFGTVRRLLRSLLTTDSGIERGHPLNDAADAVSRMLCLEDPPYHPTGARADGAETIRSLNHLVFRLARHQPLLLAIDDVQGIDPPSLRWLAGLVHQADAHPVLLAVTTRTGERPPPEALFNELVHPSISRTVRLKPLTPHSVERLVAEVFDTQRPDRSFCSACHAATDGHPLFLRALLCDARHSGLQPDGKGCDSIQTFGLHTLQRVIRHRLCQGTKDSAALARGLAILGDRRPLELLAAYCGKGEAVIRCAAAELHALGLLRAGDDLRFVHPVVRDTVLAQWSPQEVGEAHATAARVLHLGGRPDEEVAAHLLAAGPVQGTWAVTVLRRAAEEAVRRGAAETAVTYLRHAVHQLLTPEERAPVLLQLALTAGHYDPALAVSYAAAALEGLHDDSLRAKAVGVITYSSLLSRDRRGLEMGLDTLTPGPSAPAVPAPSARERHLREAALRWWLEFERPSLRSASGRPGALLDGDLRGSTPGERQLLGIRAFDALRAGEPAGEAIELINRAGVNLPTFSLDLFPLHYCVARSLLLLDQLDRAEQFCAHLLRETRERRLDLLSSSLLVYRAGIQLSRGDIGEAAATARAVAEAPHPNGEPPYWLSLDTISIDTLVEQGDLDRAESIAARHSGTDPADSSGEWPRFLMSLSALRTARGDLHGSLSLLRECGHHLAAAGALSPAISPWRSRAAALQLALGRRRDAHALLEEERDLARRCAIPRAMGLVLLAQGAMTEGTRGLDLLAEAVSTLERTPARLELARALHAYGRALMQREDNTGARTALRRGLDLAVTCGATSLAQRLQQRLYDAGGRATTRTAHPGGSLTVSEERVTTLAAQGYSNKQIAQSLFVSLRTVETHLTRAYRKLQIAGRPQLVAALGGVAPCAPSRIGDHG